MSVHIYRDYVIIREYGSTRYRIHAAPQGREMPHELRGHFESLELCRMQIDKYPEQQDGRKKLSLRRLFKFAKFFQKAE